MSNQRSSSNANDDMEHSRVDRGNLYENRARPMAQMNDTFGFSFGEPSLNSSTLSDRGNVYENMATPMAPFNDTFGFSLGEPGFNSSTVHDRSNAVNERPPNSDGAQLRQENRHAADPDRNRERQAREHQSDACKQNARH